MDEIFEIEQRIREIEGFNIENEYDETPEQKEEIRQLMKKGITLKSPYCLNRQAVEKYYARKWNVDKDPIPEEVLEMLEKSAQHGFFNCMKILAQEDNIGLSPIKRYAYLKLSRTPSGCGFYDFGDFNLNEEQEKEAIKLYEKMNAALVEYYMDEFDGY